MKGTSTLLLGFWWGVVLGCWGEERDWEGEFVEVISPFLKAHCVGCHGGERPKARFDVSGYVDLKSVLSDDGHWRLILEKLDSGEMPPEDAETTVCKEELERVVGWIRGVRRWEAERNAGDPGVVLARRLNQSELDRTIRDLVGWDLRPAREFPVDPANEEGFDNTGESLSFSPSLLKKYLEAARSVAAHLVMKPDGIEFAPHPVATETDRDKYCVNRIIGFYGRYSTNYLSYLRAAWQFQHREDLNRRSDTLETLAAEQGLSVPYLQCLVGLLEGKDNLGGPAFTLRTMWRELPGAAADPSEWERAASELARWIGELRQKVAMEFPHLKVNTMHRGSQPLVLWRNRQYAQHRRDLNREVLTHDSEDPEMRLPEGEAERNRFLAGFEAFCSVFPDRFFVSERGREFLQRSEQEKEQEKGRLLSAGFHSMMGYFRDDQALYELLLKPDEQEELDRLWRELDFLTEAPKRQHAGFIWFERTDSRFMLSEEFDFARAEDKNATSEAMLTRLRDTYLKKALENDADELAVTAIREHFDGLNRTVRWMESVAKEAETDHLEGLKDFARRAFRGGMTEADEAELLSFYRENRETHGLSHEEAMREGVVWVLMSPQFLFRVNEADERQVKVAGKNWNRISAVSLANRLSYFLWSSMPDAELMQLAETGCLFEEGVLRGQVRRMLKDEKVRGFAEDFGGNWLDFKGFESHNSVDRDRFPMFDDALRSAMQEEPVRFLIGLAQGEASMLEGLYGDYTFANGVLARHYDLVQEGESWPDEEWRRVAGVKRVNRGGLLPMAVFLTRNSPGLRTSPVKRGYWVVRRLLGEHIPAPPPNVPELPSDEGALGELTLRQVLARHREDRSCSVCHDRFDGLGVAYEGFGPVGEVRELDLGGRPVETQAEFPGGVSGVGLEGLRGYLKDQREGDYVDQVVRKMFAYGVGRGLVLSDEPTLERIRQQFVLGGYRLRDLVEEIVRSSQFLYQRAEVNVTRN